MTFSHDFFTPSSLMISSPSTHTTNGFIITTSHVGFVIHPNYLSVSNVLFALKLSMNLISMDQLCDQGLDVIFLLLVIWYKIVQWGSKWGQAIRFGCFSF